MMKYVFWALLMTIIYCYFGYPFFIFFLAKLFPKRIIKQSFLPSVSVIISAWNEEDVIKRKIDNLLSLDYPHDKLEILIGSDGCTDRTYELIKDFNDKVIRSFEYIERRGKMMVLNDLVKNARGDILLFTDTRQIFDKGAIKELVANFNDPYVGCVSGELILMDKDTGTAKGINLYWRYEKFLRRNESIFHSMLGATGAIYAIRKELFVEILQDFILDDIFVPFNIIKKGYRAIFDEKAKAYDEVADNPLEEQRRKVRTLAGNYQAFKHFIYLFDPLKSPIAIQLFSHKFLRLIVPFFMAALFLLNLFFMSEKLYGIFFILQLVFYSMALIGFLSRNVDRGALKIVSNICYVPYVFCLLNFSALMGFFKFIFSTQDVRWEKARAD